MNKTLKILEIIGEAARGTSEILGMFFTDYHTSYRIARGLPVKKYRSREEWLKAKLEQITQEEKRRFYNLLSKLKSEGLICKTASEKWDTTDKGESRKREIIDRQRTALPIAKYPIHETNEIKLVIFDIPEKIKRKRVWLRAVLKRLKFKMLQRSVWIGKTQLPEGFIHDLRKLRLLEYTEILAITKTGSLKQLK